MAKNGGKHKFVSYNLKNDRRFPIWSFFIEQITILGLNWKQSFILNLNFNKKRTVETPWCGKWRNLPSYDVIWRNDRHMTKHHFFLIFFQNFYFYDQISLFVLFNTFLRVENAFFIFNIYFRSLKFELKGYSTRVRSKKSLLMETFSNTFIQPKNPFLQVFLARSCKFCSCKMVV